MNLPTIEEIKQLRDEVKEKRKLIIPTDYKDKKFGDESEYTITSILSGLDGLMIDISALIKAPVRFVNISTHLERKQLTNVMKIVRDHTNSKDIAGLAVQIDELKPLIARYGIRHDPERLVEFDVAIDDLQRKATNLSDKLEELAEVKSTGDDINQEVRDIHSELLEKAESLEELESSLSTLIEQNQSRQTEAAEQLNVDRVRSESIESLLTEARTQKDAIEVFIKKVSQKEIQLEDQETKTTN